MPTYKNIKIKKRGGGTRIQRVQVLASGKYKFVKNTSKSSNKSKSTKRKTKKGSRKVAKKNKNSKKRKFTVPGALVAGVALGFVIKPAPNWDSPYEAAKRGAYDTAIKNYATNMIGYRADTGAIFDTTIGLKGLKALIGGFLIHKVASVIGLNRALGRAGVPYLRV